MQDIKRADAKLRSVLGNQFFRSGERRRPRDRHGLESALRYVCLHCPPGSIGFRLGQRFREDESGDGIAQFGTAKVGQRQICRVRTQPSLSARAERVLNVKRNQKASIGVGGHTQPSVPFFVPGSEDSILRKHFRAINAAKPLQDVRPRDSLFRC